jgi:hypothetical protein
MLRITSTTGKFFFNVIAESTLDLVEDRRTWPDEVICLFLFIIAESALVLGGIPVNPVGFNNQFSTI